MESNLKEYKVLCRKVVEEFVPVIAETPEKARKLVQDLCDEGETDFIFEGLESDEEYETEQVIECSQDEFKKMQREIKTVLPDGNIVWL